MLIFLIIALISTQEKPTKVDSRKKLSRKVEKKSKKAGESDSDNQDKSRTTKETFEKAKQEALHGNYKNTIKILRPLLYPTSKFANEEDEIEALRLLALSFWYQGDKANALQSFVVLLNRRPSYKLDPVLVPSGAIEFFNDIKVKLKEKLDKIKKQKELEAKRKKEMEKEARRKRLVELKKKSPILVKNVTINKNYFIFNFFPFALGQFQNGDQIKGWTSVSLQVVSGLISAGAYSYLSYKYPSGKVPLSKASSARQIQYLQVGSGLFFFGVWLISAVDAVINYKPSRQEVKRQLYRRDKNKFKLFGSPLPEGGAVFGIKGEF
ncbi:MAG: hypothetical protein PF689_11240 [Deltaproteobacteria bacterium]|jgi:hypothetical protein|nr:hypothetical protein [Deltaproteobacteria bacterium]